MTLKDRYIQAMVLSGVGDALGYKNGNWEFCHSGKTIYEELKKLGGLEKVKVKLPNWMVSDDTVMHLATGEALIDQVSQADHGLLFLRMADFYKKCMHDMGGRAPGNTCMSCIHQLKPLINKGYQIPFNPRGGGCGAAMRAMCIGLRYPRPSQLNDLIEVSVESGRMSHHHPTGYLGALAAALFTSYCVQGVNTWQWGKGLMDTLPLALKYVESTGHCVKENKEAWGYFTEQWEKYLKLRGLEEGNTAPVFPDKFDFDERDKFYKSVSFSGWGGSSGHDAPMIAYDAFLGANGNWLELCKRGLFHGGDSDSTGVMAACWFGVIYGWDGVPLNNYKKVEYKERLEKIGAKLYDLAFPVSESDGTLKEGQVQVGILTKELIPGDVMKTQDVVETDEASKNETASAVKEIERLQVDGVKDETTELNERKCCGDGEQDRSSELLAEKAADSVLEDGVVEAKEADQDEEESKPVSLNQVVLIEKKSHDE